MFLSEQLLSGNFKFTFVIVIFAISELFPISESVSFAISKCFCLLKFFQLYNIKAKGNIVFLNLMKSTVLFEQVFLNTEQVRQQSERNYFSRGYKTSKPKLTSGAYSLPWGIRPPTDIFLRQVPLFHFEGSASQKTTFFQ